MSDVRVLHVVGAAILDGEGRCVATRRSASMALPLKWEFPGGKVEVGESPQEALAREIHEELGVTIAVGSRLGVGFADKSPTTRVRLEVFAARLVEGDIALREHDRWGWFDAEGLRGLDWAEADVPIIAPLINAL